MKKKKKELKQTVLSSIMKQNISSMVIQEEFWKRTIVEIIEF